MSEPLFLRQQRLVNQKRLKELTLTIVGCGSVGSFTALTVSKLGVKNLVLFDKDNVEPHNITNQFFCMKHLRKNKAQVTKELCEQFTPQKQDIRVFPFIFDKKTEVYTEVIIASTDSIESRKIIFENSLKSKFCKLYIDVRMLANDLNVFCIPFISTMSKEHQDKNDKLVEQFREDYIKDVTNQKAPCTARTIIYNVLMCASLLTNMISKYVNNEELPYVLGYNFKKHIHLIGEKP